ncbi:MAG: RloB family protein [Myxococcales bacterium]|nr:RloB family protein [Myxococcales bacterium]
MFVIATDDTYAPRQYFEAFNLQRIKIHVVATDNGRCAAADVLTRMKEVIEDGRARGDLRDDDQFWLVLDTDHYTQGTHVPAFKSALKEALEAGIRTAVSKPCFELWLLLHVREVKEQFENADEVAAALQAELGAYNKTNVPGAQLVPNVRLAITRARTLDVGVEGGWPQNTGTQVHLLADQLTTGP